MSIAPALLAVPFFMVRGSAPGVSLEAGVTVLCVASLLGLLALVWLLR